MTNLRSFPNPSQNAAIEEPTSLSGESSSHAGDSTLRDRTPMQIPYEDAFDMRKTDSLKFLVQIVLSAAMLILCMGHLNTVDSNLRVLYWSGITGVLGWWMPSPGSSKSAPSPGRKE